MRSTRIRWGNVGAAAAAIVGLVFAIAWLRSGEGPPPLPPPVHFVQQVAEPPAPVPAGNPVASQPKRRERRHRGTEADRARHADRAGGARTARAPVVPDARTPSRQDPPAAAPDPSYVPAPPKPEFALE